MEVKLTGEGASYVIETRAVAREGADGKKFGKISHKNRENQEILITFRLSHI